VVRDNDKAVVVAGARIPRGLHGIGMIAEDGIDALNLWLAKAGLRGEPEAALVSGFCERAVATSLPLRHALVFIDTLHPVYEGRWSAGGRTLLIARIASTLIAPTRRARP
jgi:hypothetical protein